MSKVEIMAHAFGLNFRDVLMAMGQLQEKYLALEYDGHISRKGAQIPEDLAIGQRVCALLRANCPSTESKQYLYQIYINRLQIGQLGM